MEQKQQKNQQKEQNCKNQVYDANVVKPRFYFHNPWG